MDTRHEPQRPQYTAGQKRLQVLSTVIVGLLVVWLYVYTPSFLFPYRFWIQLAVIVIDLALAIWFLACSLLYHTQFAHVIGTGPNNRIVTNFGPKGTRLYLLFMGLFLLVLGIYGLVVLLGG